MSCPRASYLQLCIFIHSLELSCVFHARRGAFPLGVSKRIKTHEEDIPTSHFQLSLG